MASINVSEKQSVFDIAVQKLGSCEAAFVLALQNGLSVCDELAPGTCIELPQQWNSKLADYFTKKNLVPSTYSEEAAAPQENIQVIYWSNDLERVSGKKVSERQSLFDVSLQYCGSLEAVMELALLNALSLTDELSPGQLLEIPNVVDGDVVSYFSNKGIVLETVSQEDNEEAIPTLEGIDYWAIEVDFIVS